MTLDVKETENNVSGAIEAVESHLHPPASFDLADHPVPTGREEVWRFTPQHRIKPLLADVVPGQHADAVGVTVHAPDGIDAGTLAVGQSPRGDVLVPADRPAALAHAGAPQARWLRIPAEFTSAEPLRVDVEGRGTEGVSAAHHVIDVGAHAQVTIILEHTGSARHLENVEINVGTGASLTLVSLQNWADDTLHAAQHQALVGRDATFRHVNVTFGGDLVRMHTNVSYAGPGGSAELFGLYFADAGQHIEHRLFVDHDAPRTKSNVDYRGALQGQDAHAVWIGDVLIRTVAEDIETYEANKNLVLTEGCRADSVPNLEIQTGEIAGAGHSSTTGRFDDEQLFYLTSRGIDPAEAKRLVVHGFFNEIIRRVGVPQLEARLLAAVEEELARSVGSKVLA